MAEGQEQDKLTSCRLPAVFPLAEGPAPLDFGASSLLLHVLFTSMWDTGGAVRRCDFLLFLHSWRIVLEILL